MSNSSNRLAVSLRRSFAAGLLVLVPLLLTIWIVEQLFRVISGVLDRPVAFVLGGIEKLEDPLPLLGWAGVKVGHIVPLLSTIALLLIILLLGMIARNILGARTLAAGDRLLVRIPIIRRIYQAVRQISEAFLSSQKGAFKRAVMFEYPRKGIWSVGFVTSDSVREFTHRMPGEAYYHIFLPTTPNPTSGFMLIVEQQDCLDLEMPVEDALKLIISGGAVSPDKLPAASMPGSEE